MVRKTLSYALGCWWYVTEVGVEYRDADKSLVRPGMKKATATEDFEFHITYLYQQVGETEEDQGKDGLRASKKIYR